VLENKPPLKAEPDLRTYFAAEQTTLAWVRTGLAMMGFGFVVARFGLFLRELAAVRGLSAH
jgi:putative membrane protein